MAKALSVITRAAKRPRAPRRKVTRKAPSTERIRIRMYRQGIGDCFLLTFPAPDRPRHVLIDCGVHTSTPKGGEWMRRIVTDIRTVTGSRIDVLAVTHEHWDHMSAFAQPELFRGVEIGELWLAWTEDPEDALARKLGHDRAARLTGLATATKQLRKADAKPLQDVGSAVGEVLSFFEPPDPRRGFSPRTRRAFDALKQLASSKRYLKPGELVDRPELLPLVKVFVLGPPRDEAMIKDETGTIGVDTYELAGPGRSFFAGVWAAAGSPTFESGVGSTVDYVPFPLELQWNAKKFEKEFPGVAKTYNARCNDWRRIDHDWLVSSAQLALQLDSDTNNTSLVLAFEVAGARVLLFTGDAQIGNWKSWTSLEWTLVGSDAREKRVVRAKDLLGHTVFYKVGHHGSHNATRGPQGLESMTSRDLVAAIPVNREVANKLKGWDMPAPPLETHLKRATHGRLLRADKTWPASGEPMPPDGETAGWKQFLDNVKFGRDAIGDLYVDYFV